MSDPRQGAMIVEPRIPRPSGVGESTRERNPAPSWSRIPAVFGGSMSARRLIFLAIETTCDETGAAVLEGPRPPEIGVPTVRSSVVASQIDLHERFQGVVPEIASRAHV